MQIKPLIKMNLQKFAEPDPPPLDVDLPLQPPTPEVLSDSVAASVAAAQSALEDSMQKASALQMTAMQTAIAEFKAATEEIRGLSGLMTGVLEQMEDLKGEALELVEALLPLQSEAQEDRKDGENILQSTIGKPTHIKILKTILSK